MGLFVTFEGPEGGGKTTQIKLLDAWLREQGIAVLTTREPGGTAVGDQVRAILLSTAHVGMLAEAEVLLFSAARAQIVREMIRPHLEQGGTVLCDRYADSTLAYQGYGRELDLETLRTITAFATGGLWPDVTICLDLPATEGLARRRRATDGEWNRLDAEELAFHERVRDGYLALAAESSRWVVLDARQPIELLQQAIRGRLAERLNLKP